MPSARRRRYENDAAALFEQARDSLVVMDAAVNLSHDEGISLSAFLLELVQTIDSDRLKQSRHASRGDDSLREPSGAVFRGASP